MEIQLLPAQLKFVTTENPYPAIVGGLGSGKSEGAIKRLLFLMLQDPGINTLYTLPTYDLIKLRAMPGVEENLESLGIKYQVNKSDYAITIPGYGVMYLRSYDKPERIVSFEVAHSICDELDTLPKAKAKLVWRKVSERTRQKCKTKNTIGNVTTPDAGFSGFTYEKWGKPVLQDGYELIKASTLDNFYLPESYVEQIRANYDDLLAEMYLQGEFVNLLEHKVYSSFNRQTCHAKIQVPEDARLVIGQDFNVGGCVSIIGYQHQGVLYIIGEMVSNRTDEIRGNYDRRYKDLRATMYPDASGNNASSNATQTDIQILRAAGFGIKVNASNPRVRDRILSLNIAFKKGLCKIDTEACPKLTEALEQQAYLENGEPEKITGAATIDDFNDAIGYLNFALNPIVRPVARDVIMSA